MMHSVTLITTIAAGFGLALIFGFLAVRLGLPALIGYLLAGVVLGPATPGYVADLEIAGQLAEIGVMLLMFGVGLHFSFQDLLSVRRIALPGAVVQIAVATALGAGLASLWGWKLSSGIVFGFALSVASTVVLLRALRIARRARIGQRPHRGRLAGGRGPRDGAGAGADAAPRRGDREPRFHGRRRGAAHARKDHRRDRRVRRC